MSIPTPRLDDRSFEELRRNAMEFVRQRNGTWDDLSDGDPGAILLEAFAYLTDVVLYRVNRVPEKARREYLALLGVTVSPAGAAAARLTISRTSEDSSQRVDVPAGTRVTATGSTGRDHVEFITAAPVHLDAGEVEASVIAHQCEQILGEYLGTSTGEPGQRFLLGNGPVVRPTGHELDLVIAVESDDRDLAERPEAIRFDGRSYVVWRVVESFAGLEPGTRAVRVDRSSGTVTFAPKVRRPGDDGELTEHPVPLGAIPPSGRQIRAWYRVGGGSRGNVAAGSIRTFVPGSFDGLAVVNTERAVGGCDAETLEHALRRAPELLHEPRRAVTADDFEALASREAGVSRARAITEAEQWAHATAGTVEVRLVPSVDDDEPPGAERLRAGSQQHLLERTRTVLERQQPLGVRSVVRWAQYKEVTIRLRIVVGRTEDVDAVRRRVERRLHTILSPTPTDGNPNGWAFGRSLRASNVHSAVFEEPGVRFADQISMELSDCPDGDIGALAADRFQPNTWYVGQGGTLFRSENGGLGWEVMHTFPDGVITKIVPARDRAGHVAAIVLGDDGRASRVFASTDAGSTWPANPVAAFSWTNDEASQVIRDVCWLPRRHDDLALATDRGLYRVKLDNDTPRPWVVDPGSPDTGCWAVATAPTGDGGLEVAVAMRSRGGVWLTGPDLDEPFRSIGLDGVDVRSLIVERRNIRSFLWAPAFAVGDDAGTGCHRVELRGSSEARLDWTHFGTAWNGGICHDLAFVGDQVLAASEFNGVLVVDLSSGEPAWRPPSVQNSGLPLLENRRFQPVRSIDAAWGVALAGTAQSVHRTNDGRTYRNAARRRVNDTVTLPASWLFASGSHEVVVESDDS